MRSVIAILILLVAGCVPLPSHYSGGTEPVDNPMLLTVTQVEEAQNHGCTQTWVTGNADRDIETAHAWFRDKGITLRERRFIAKGALVALPGILTLPKGFDERDTARQVRSLAHEAAHYCREDENPDWRADWAASPGRWVEEVIAESQEIRTAVIQGVDPNVNTVRVDQFRDYYKLHDIDHDQLEAASLEVWSAAMEDTL